jgi:hypothetical protein
MSLFPSLQKKLKLKKLFDLTIGGIATLRSQ